MLPISSLFTPNAAAIQPKRVGIVFGRANPSHHWWPPRPDKQISQETQSTASLTSEQVPAVGARAVTNQNIKLAFDELLLLQRPASRAGKEKRFEHRHSVFSFSTLRCYMETSETCRTRTSCLIFAILRDTFSSLEESWTIRDTKSRSERAVSKQSMAHCTVQKILSASKAVIIFFYF